MMRMVVGRAEPISAFITTADGLPDRATRSDGMNDKKKWSKPELIVLVRGKPEEAVLGQCKAVGVGPRAANDNNTDCEFGSPVCFACATTFINS
jgi:hypothetical protein